VPMTLDNFRDLLFSADPTATKWKGAGTGNYTVWHPFEFSKMMADGQKAGGISRIQVDRFTKLDNDPVVDAIETALSGEDEITFQHLVDFEQDTGYIHHIFDCEVV